MFWERKDELEDQDRIMALIEKGEQKIQRKKDIRNALETKVQQIHKTADIINALFLLNRCLSIGHHSINSTLSMAQIRVKIIPKRKTGFW